MDFFEAMAEMKTGGRVRLKSWPKEAFIGIQEESSKVFGKQKTKYTVLNHEECDISPNFPFSILVKSEWEAFTD